MWVYCIECGVNFDLMEQTYHRCPCCGSKELWGTEP